MRQIIIGLVGLLVLVGIPVLTIRAQVHSPTSNKLMTKTTISPALNSPVAAVGSKGMTSPSGTSPAITAIPDVPQLPPAKAPEGISGIRPTKAGVPVFTEQDVRDYVNRHPTRFQNPAKPLPIIQKVEFLSAQAVRSRFSTATGLPDDTPLCLVVRQGDFFVGGPAGANLTGTIEYQVFDARTGNVVLIGVDQ